MSTAANPIPDPTTDSPPRRRRWIPMSVWVFMAMLVVLPLISVIWIGLPAYRQRIAAQNVSKAARNMSVRPGALKPLARFAPQEYESIFDDVVELWLGGSAVSDAALQDVGRLTSLEWLSLRDTEITNSGLVHLKGLTRLKWLSLSRTRIDDAGLKHLTGLKSLEYLALNGMHISDAAVAELKQALPGLSVERRSTVASAPHELLTEKNLE